MERLRRRQVIGAGRARVGVDEALLRSERCPRVVAARSVRARLRQGATVALVHPTWSDVEGFLEDIRVDLAVADHPLHAVDLRAGAGLPPAGSGAVYGWWAAGPGADEGDAAEVLAAWRAQVGPRGGPLLFGWPERLGPPPAEAVAVALPDHDEDGAVDFLAGYVGGHAAQLRPLARRLGGLPALLREAARGAAHGAADDLAERAWAAIAGEVFAAAAPLRGVPAVARRLAALAEGPRPYEPEVDDRLRGAGLVAFDRGQTGLRSPWFVGL